MKLEGNNEETSVGVSAIFQALNYLKFRILFMYKCSLSIIGSNKISIYQYSLSIIGSNKISIYQGALGDLVYFFRLTGLLAALVSANASR